MTDIIKALRKIRDERLLEKVCDSVIALVGAINVKT